jgi:hypothetical protein
MSLDATLSLLIPQWPYTSSGIICYNHLSVYHAGLSFLSHLGLILYRKVINSQNQRDEDSKFDIPFSALVVLQHYCLVWLSILTSPTGRQLDLWLCVLVFMDMAPIVISAYHTVKYLIDNYGYEDLYDPTSVFWRLTSAMRSWSPAYQLNNLIMHYVEGCLMKHLYILFMFTLAITQIHRCIVSNVYCTSMR